MVRGGKKERKRKKSKTFGETKYLARGGEDEQRRKRKKIWREKSFGDADDQNQQSTN